MDDRTIFVAGAVFLVALAASMIRLGNHNGGVAWALAWLCLYGSGVCAMLGERYPALMPLAAILTATFAGLLFQGAARFTGRSTEYVRPLVLAVIGVGLFRLALMPFVSVPVGDAVGSGAIVLAVAGCCWMLLRPQGRKSTPSERMLGYAFPLVGVAAVFYSWAQLTAHSMPVAFFGWLLAGLVLGSFKSASYISLASERMERLRDEAERSRNAQTHLETRYRQVTEQASDMISELDAEGTVLYANPAHRTILGVDPDALIGRPVGALSYTPSSESIFSQKNNASAFTQHVLMARHDDGRPVTLECNFRRFTSPGGNERLVVTSRDISERAANERLREESRAQLEALVESRTEELRASLTELQKSQRLASMGTMAAGIAHQINNPIGSIQMAAEFALGSNADDPERESVWREALENAIVQAQRCGRIVSSMLQFARNERIKKFSVDLAEIVRRACEQTEGYARSHHAEIDTTGLHGPLVVQASAIEIEQVVLNLVRNACESSDDTVRIRVRSEEQDECALVTIEDDGRGMAQPEIDRALDPFFTTRLDRGGTGLGLSVVHSVITDHAGHLSIESTPGKGTRISFTVPLDKTHPETAIAGL